MTADSRRPQLTFDELQQLRWLLGGVLTLLGLATVAYLDVEAWWLMALTATASIATTWRPSLPARIPRIIHLLAFPFIAAFFALDLWLHSELLPAMVRLDMLLLLYRALVYRQRRDDLQVIVLGLFLVVIAGVLTVSLAFALQILVYTACALLFLLVLTLLEGREPVRAAAAMPPGAKATPPGWAAHAHWGRLLRRVATVVDWRIAALAGGLFLGVIAASALLFLIIPRFQLDTGMFLDRFVSKKARSGFSESIKFGDVTEIQQDTSVALHVDVSDVGQIPLAPYWRMLVLDDYGNGSFKLSPGLQMAAFEPHAHTGSVVFGPTTLRRTRGTWVMYLEPGISRYLPLLGHFRVLKFSEAQTYRSAPESGLLQLVKDPVTMTAYQVDSFDLSTPTQDPPGSYYRERPLSLDPVEAGRERSTLHRLAITAAGPGPLSTSELAGRLCAWLRERHTYSLSPRIPAGPGDPLVRWIDSREPGHCELFAGSLVLLARAAGYPARVVIGFRGGSWNAYVERSFTVRNSDAHAWAEIYDHESRSWLRADPLEISANSQAQNGPAAAAAGGHVDRSWSARLDSLRVFWYRRVVSFDQAAQVQTLKEAKQLAQNLVERVRLKFSHGASALSTWLRSPWDTHRFVRVGFVLAGALALTFLWRALRQLFLRRIWRSPRRRDDPVRREAGRWLRRLSVDPAALEHRVVMADLQRLRFGARPTWPDPARVFRSARRITRRTPKHDSAQLT